MVCSCVDNSSTDSTILQVLKVLRTAVASMKFRVHGEPLLGIIRVCNNITLHSKSPINQATSKAMLTQMISILFRRMETDVIPTSSGSSDNSTSKAEEASSGDQYDNGTTLGDALNWVKDATFPSIEELQKLAGAADIKDLLGGVSHSFTKDLHLIDSVKSYLLYALLQASISQSPVIFQVHNGMCFTNNKIFKNNLGVFYPLLTKLICCDQMDVRGALGDLFRVQLKALLP